MNREKKTPAVGAAGEMMQNGLAALHNNHAVSTFQGLVERYNAAVRAINRAELDKPQLNHHDGLSFTRHRRRLIVIDHGRVYEITTRPGWDLWQAPGFNRKAFQRSALAAGDVLTIRNMGRTQ